MATKNKKSIAASFSSNYENVLEKTSNLNSLALKSTEKTMVGVIETLSKWQSFAEKNVKDGLQLSADKQVVFFDTLENTKDYLTNGLIRSKKLFSKN